MGLHERVAAAAGGRLPEWARVGAERRAHIERVAALMASWAQRRGMSEEDQARWSAAGYLHDALKEADPDMLRALISEDLGALPDGVLHGPSAREKLLAEGVSDAPLLLAVAFHTLGHPDLDDLGRALYVADFTEPGRPSLGGWREELRDRMPHELDAVTKEVAAARIRRLVERGVPLSKPTVDFWNALAVEPVRVGGP
ncbi:MAG: HD domain-containing protein [Gemmatimonadota bacterium]